MKWENKK